MTKTQRVSPSAVKTFRECRANWKWKNLDKATPPEDTQSIHLRTGNAVHNALERIYKWVRSTGYVGPLDTPNILGRAAATTQATLTDLDVTHPDDIERCVAQVIDYLVDRTVDAADIIGVEEWMRINWPNLKIQSNNKADRVDKDGRVHLTIHDYKTGRHTKTSDQLHNDLQARMYAVAARKRWPWAQTVTFILDQLHDGSTAEVFWTADQIDVIEQELIDELGPVADQMRSGPWPTNRGWWCKTSPFKPNCPEWGGTPTEKMGPLA